MEHLGMTKLMAGIPDLHVDLQLSQRRCLRFRAAHRLGAGRSTGQRRQAVEAGAEFQDLHGGRESHGKTGEKPWKNVDLWGKSGKSRVCRMIEKVFDDSVIRFVFNKNQSSLQDLAMFFYDFLSIFALNQSGLSGDVVGFPGGSIFHQHFLCCGFQGSLVIH
jgi:hypothetical protein